ncbi:MAG: ATP-binding cassette domain-containing protein [Verrucomicrobiae bacterium]|nr:ATP-binding cassette domain-containing protein [Verrucomicrobiae bacterium]
MPPPPPEILRVSALSMHRDTTVILDGIDWRVRPGEHWVLLGANGSGKSSLLNCLLAFDHASAGEIRVLGQTYGETDWRRLRRHIGIVSATLASHFLPQDTALENVASGRRGILGLWEMPSAADVKEALAVMRRLKIAPLRDRPWEVLSQGERQKVQIARALMARPRLLILDEPCAGLDPAARESFLLFLDSLTRRRAAPAFVLVTHHVEEIMPSFDHTLILHRGRVLAQGPTGKVLTEGNLSRAFGARIRLRKSGGRYTSTVQF